MQISPPKTLLIACTLCLALFGLSQTLYARDEAPLAVSEILRKTYDAWKAFDTLALSRKSESGLSHKASNAWIRRHESRKWIEVQTEETWNQNGKTETRIILRKEKKAWRLLGNKALLLEFPVKIPGIGSPPPTVGEYERILRNANELRRYSVDADVEMRGILCYQLTYHIQEISDNKLRDEADRLKETRLSELRESGVSEDELAKVSALDFFDSVKRGKVVLRSFYVSKKDFFTFGWEYYNYDGELLYQKFYDDYRIDEELEKDYFATLDKVEIIPVESPEMYTTLLNLEN